MATPVVFKIGTRAQFDALAEKNPNALYFLTDTHEIYRGADGMAQNSYRSDIKTVEASDLEVIQRYYDNNKSNGIHPVKGDVFAVKTHIVDEKYAQSVYMYDGAVWQSISSTVNIEGDNLSIEVNENNVIALKNFGKRFYKFIEETEEAPSHYELVEVDEQNPWDAGLEPKVTLENGNYVIGWYQPNLVTAEGVQDQVTAVQGTVADVQNTVNETKQEVNTVKTEVSGLDEILNGTEDNPGGLVGEVEDIADILYGTEGESPVPGLIENVETLEGAIADVEENLSKNYYTKEETYTRTEIDGKVAGVFHFKGTTEVYENLPAEGNVAGDVYQVGELEYAWNGTEWVELGFVVDLSNHATKAEVKEVADALDLVEVDVADHEDRLVAVESTLNAEGTGLVAVAGDLQTRVGALEIVGAEKNVLVGLNIDGVALTINEARTIDMPIFAGATAGLVPAAAPDLEDKANLFLNAEGKWSIVNIGDLGESNTVTEYVNTVIVDRIGNLGDHATVTDYVDHNVAAAVEEAMSWDSI